MEHGASGQTVLVIHPAWHQCGSNVLIERQIDAYQRLGHRVVSLAVGTDAGASLADAPFWEHYFKATGGNPADVRYCTAHPGEVARKARILTDWVLRRCRTQVAQRGVPAALSRIPEPLIAELSTGAVCLMHVNHCFCMPLALRIRDTAGRPIPIALETQDVQSHQYRSAGFVNMVTRRPDALDAMLADEHRLMTPASLLVHLNEDEHAFWRERMPGKEHRLIYPTVTPHETPAAEPSDVLAVFSGNLLNQVSCRWFLEEVMTDPRLAGRSLAIVGPIDAFLTRFGDADLVRKWSGSFKGAVDDLAPWYAGSQVVALPMRVGHGISIKTIEACAYEKTFVGTANAFRGVDPRHLAEAGIEPVDDARGFADRLVASLEGRVDDAAAGRALYGKLFAPQIYLDAVRGVFDTLVA